MKGLHAEKRRATKPCFDYAGFSLFNTPTNNERQKISDQSFHFPKLLPCSNYLLQGSCQIRIVRLIYFKNMWENFSYRVDYLRRNFFDSVNYSNKCDVDLLKRVARHYKITVGSNNDTR